MTTVAAIDCGTNSIRLLILRAAQGDIVELAREVRLARLGQGVDATVDVGRDTSGPVRLDLRRDGPHALVGGTTGSGKSELLRTLIASLALRNRPDRSFLRPLQSKPERTNSSRWPSTLPKSRCGMEQLRLRLFRTTSSSDQLVKDSSRRISGGISS